MSKTSEVRVFAVVLAFLLVGEVSLKKMEPQLSGDVRHIQSVADVSGRLAQDSTPFKVLWLGNSITDDGVDLPLADSLFEEGLRGSTAMYAVHPDGSGIAEWTHIASNAFFDRGSVPNVLVIPFAWNLLSDQSAVEAERIGRWYLFGPSDWLEFLRFDAGGFETGARAVLANASAAFGNRDRVRTRVLGHLPGYQAMAESLSKGGESSATPVAAHHTYDRLARIATAARAARTRLVVVAMPVRAPYDLDPALLAILSSVDIGFIDARHVDGLSEQDFRDQMHLLPPGARIVTRRVAQELLAAHLPTPSRFVSGTDTE
jgi:hypothetical protein